MLVDGSMADLAVVGFSAFMIAAGCAKLLEKPAARLPVVAPTTAKSGLALERPTAHAAAPRPALAPAAQLAKLNVIIDKAVATANAASINQAAASVQIDAAEMAFNRLLREIGGVMHLDVLPTVTIRRQAEPAPQSDVGSRPSAALAA